jgi:hypothetical protein
VKQTKPEFDKSMREVNNSDTFAAANPDPNKYKKYSVGTHLKHGHSFINFITAVAYSQ